MNYLRFLFSKVFLRQLGFAFIAGCLLLVGVYYGLDKITENNKHIEVPDFETLSIQEIPEIVERFELRYEVLDSAKFNPNYPPYAVIEQSPKAGSAVKRGRKIYFTLNPSGYRKLKVPNVIQVTKRNAETRLTAVGFSLGEISFFVWITTWTISSEINKEKPKKWWVYTVIILSLVAISTMFFVYS